jgi:glycosyltransferase involved in cell wall biosynthesis
VTRQGLELPKLLHVLVGADRGGCERDSYILSGHLTNYAHTVVVLGSPGPMSREWETAGAVVEHLNIMKLSRAKRLLGLKRALGALTADGVIIWHGMAELPALLHALPMSCGPILIHGGNPALGFRGWTDLRYLMMERRWPHAHDPIYVCCSRYVSESFDRSRYLRRFRRCVIHNGVEHEEIVTHQPRRLSSSDSPLLGMMARLDSIKDHRTLLQAMAHLVRSFPEACLELAGDGEGMPALQRLVRDLGLQENVRFLGSVAKIYETIARWDIFVYAATPREGFGNAVAEALMCGLPCIVSDLPPLREVCGSGHSVEYVPVGDPTTMATAIGTLIYDFAARSELSKSARAWAEAELSAEVYARRYADVLESERKRMECASSIPAKWK